MVIIISVSWSTNNICHIWQIIFVISGSFWLIDFPPHRESYLPACLYAWDFSLDARHCELLVASCILFNISELCFNKKLSYLETVWSFQSFLIYLSFIFYWSIVELQHFVNYCCAAKWLSFSHIHSFSFSPPLWFIIGYWIQFPVPSSRTLLLTLSIYNSLHLLTPNSYPYPLPPPFPLATTHQSRTNFSSWLWHYPSKYLASCVYKFVFFFFFLFTQAGGNTSPVWFLEAVPLLLLLALPQPQAVSQRVLRTHLKPGSRAAPGRPHSPSWKYFLIKAIPVHT